MMIQTKGISKLLNVGHSGFVLRSTGNQLLSTSANPTRGPSRPSKETSEQAVGGTTDDIAHSKGAFDSDEANPEKSASKISAGGISMEQSAANEASSLSSQKTPVKKKAPNTQK
ncbi:uncharacterized protein PGTG_03352 [Puccinia graminis f. sp. tritici CRL 75-36-700-3]|uniref:Uncharacterized protein n=1 Tax=Puccinia graminis f. sp. tritici (strain CRL 75-36-700-3 / race SCCL) TaxID=418459 RepID=E3JZC1_PUCGT|nr:uncharacterized protein PGTG_03352 [Puccinia graminis f. sp. tritici CRL 75-36-700-3]EFP77396.1 hypothetical protein PGTG_03352 [Puccinia graminis f. sp. tritici CRL 75-36-700-3]